MLSDDRRVVCLVKGDERYVFIYDNDELPRLLLHALAQHNSVPPAKAQLGVRREAPERPQALGSRC